tara:strand:+ start:966 stop:1343 length:378 start_codon:yes stop_codon:yes gene_type:complete
MQSAGSYKKLSKSDRTKLNNHVIDALRHRYPLAFNDKYPPLKIGIHADLLAICETSAQRQAARNVLWFWTSNKKYIKNIARGGDRVDLDGKKTGAVLPCEQKSAKKRLESIKQDAKNNKNNNLKE